MVTTYIVRPYYGYDCNSWDGFNNGNYLDDIEVVAEDSAEAITKAIEFYIKEFGWPKGAEIDGWFGEGTIYWVTDVVDSENYLYRYIDFNNIEDEGK